MYDDGAGRWYPETRRNGVVEFDTIHSAGVLGLTRAPEQRSEHLRHDDSKFPLARHIELYKAIAVWPADDAVRAPQTRRCAVICCIEMALLRVILTCKP